MRARPFRSQLAGQEPFLQVDYPKMPRRMMAELYFRQKVDEGLRQLDAGEGIEHEEAKQRLARWSS